mmetsp:Transcript_39770/g.105073  ORF Transcript_39770/g.105073 Transcript_39770/m.105073 type:complete len:212 (+) Transcript_39770:818-1453(+)
MKGAVGSGFCSAEPGMSNAKLTAGSRPSALKMAKKMGLSEEGSLMASARSRASSESAERVSNEPGEKNTPYAEKPSHAAAIAARVGRVRSISSVDGVVAHARGDGVRRALIAGTGARGAQTPRRGRSLSASELSVGVCGPRAAMSRAKTTLPSAPTSLREIPAGPFSPLTTTFHVRHAPIPLASSASRRHENPDEREPSAIRSTISDVPEG